MEVKSNSMAPAIALLILWGATACSEDHTTKTEAATTMTNPCAPVQNPCAAKNPCAMKNPCSTTTTSQIDPHLITRPANTELFSGAERSTLVAEGKKLFADSSLSSNGSSCNSCHATDNLFGASFATPYPHPVTMAKEKAGLERALRADEFIQFCMIVPMAAEPLPWNSRELAALTAYVVDVRQKDFGKSGEGNPCAMKNPCAVKNPCEMAH